MDGTLHCNRKAAASWNRQNWTLYVFHIYEKRSHLGENIPNNFALEGYIELQEIANSWPTFNRFYQVEQMMGNKIIKVWTQKGLHFKWSQNFFLIKEAAKRTTSTWDSDKNWSNDWWICLYDAKWFRKQGNVEMVSSSMFAKVIIFLCPCFQLSSWYLGQQFGKEFYWWGQLKQHQRERQRDEQCD